MNWVPVFCYNCGIPYGYVPQENCSFACWLCDPCADKWGIQFGLMLMPDEVFWQKVAAEQYDKYSRILSQVELQELLDSTPTALTKLIKEGV